MIRRTCRRALALPARPAAVLVATAVAAATAAVAPARPAAAVSAAGVGRQPILLERGRTPEAAVLWRRSRSLGRPNRGRLVGGVELPAEGTHFVTFDPVHRSSPNRAWRRHGTSRLVEVLLRVARRLAQALVDRFARAGAQFVFVGPNTRLRGRTKVVVVLGNHDDHLHVRIRSGTGSRR